MSDYISRERAANIFSRARAAMKPSDYRTFDKMNTRDLMLLNAEQAINAIPAADVAKVRHGHWWDRGSLSCRCSCCGCKNNRETRYCPNCGARMDESEKEDDVLY